MKTVFIDTNVILDVLLQNDDFWQDSLKIIRQVELGVIKACVSASSITDIFYIIRKKLSVSVARTVIENLLNLFVIVGVDGDDLRNSLNIAIDDIEDALQVWCAKKSGAEVLITRNIKDFNNIDIPVVHPTDFEV